MEIAHPLRTSDAVSTTSPDFEAAREQYLIVVRKWATSHGEFLDLVYGEYLATGEWPDVAKLQRRRDGWEIQSDVDLIDISFNIPSPLGHRDPSSDRVVLTIRGIAECDGTTELLSDFVRAVKLAHGLWAASADQPDAAKITRVILQDRLELEGQALDGLDRLFRKVHLTFGSPSTYGDGHWDFAIYDSVRKFKSIGTIADYLRVEAELLLDRYMLARAGFWDPYRSTIAARGSSSTAAAPASGAWDVFLCHASEDKQVVADLLATQLSTANVSVWYDRFELTVGDSLRKKIDEGLAHCRYGVVVLSHSFFSKHWPQAELDGLASREVNGDKVILPVWYGLTAADVLGYSPLLAGRLAARWEDGLTAVLDQLLKAIHK